MQTGFPSHSQLINPNILKGLQNLSLSQNKTQALNKKDKTQSKDEPIKNKLKHKTLPLSMLSKITKVSQFEKLVHTPVSDLILKQFIIDLYRGVRYSIKSLVGPHQSVISLKGLMLKEPPQSKQKFLFLDLDQTLIFTERQKSLNSKQISFKIRIRPYAQEFLSNLSQHYTIYVFTAATKEYAEAVIQKLDSKKKYIQDYLCRDDCFQTRRGKVIKDLRIVKNRTLNDMVLVDNKAESFGLQIDNGIPILDFYGDKNDVELQHLQKILIQISKLEDVRKGISQHCRLRELAQISKEELQEYVKKGVSFGSSDGQLNQLMNS